METIYLDNSAGSRPFLDVVETIVDILTNHWGNDNGDYSLGHDARTIIDEVTNQVADDINCDLDEIIWTSGACEANSLAIMGVLDINPHMFFLTTHLEHTSINEAVKHLDSHCFDYINNNSEGYIDIDDLETKLQDISNRGYNFFVSISAANSEIGVIQDIKKISNIVHRYNGILHVDATQLYPWYKINVQELGIDLMSISGQKMNCVKGIGFLYIRNGVKIKPIIYGSQQKGRRGGTMPTHLIAAFGKALELTRSYNATIFVENLRNNLLNQLLLIDNVYLNGPSVDSMRLPNNISLTIDGVNAGTLITMCDLMGVVIARGSACKSYEPMPSKSLLSIGLTPKQALSTIRITLGGLNTEEEIDIAADIITKLVARIREENT